MTFRNKKCSGKNVKDAGLCVFCQGMTDREASKDENARGCTQRIGVETEGASPRHGSENRNVNEEKRELLTSAL